MGFAVQQHPVVDGRGEGDLSLLAAKFCRRALLVTGRPLRRGHRFLLDAIVSRLGRICREQSVMNPVKRIGAELKPPGDRLLVHPQPVAGARGEQKTCRS